MDLVHLFIQDTIKRNKMNLNDISQSILTARKEFNEKITLLSEIAKPILLKEFSLLFDSVPELEYVYWTQYTPSFNDGDKCEFSVHDIEWEGEVSYDQLKNNQHFINVNKFTQNNEEIMEEMYGDYIKITIQRDGTEVTSDYYD